MSSHLYLFLANNICISTVKRRECLLSNINRSNSNYFDTCGKIAIRSLVEQYGTSSTISLFPTYFSFTFPTTGVNCASAITSVRGPLDANLALNFLTINTAEKIFDVTANSGFSFPSRFSEGSSRLAYVPCHSVRLGIQVFKRPAACFYIR